MKLWRLHGLKVAASEDKSRSGHELQGLYTTQVCWGYVGIVEKKMETIITLGDI